MTKRDVPQKFTLVTPVTSADGDIIDEMKGKDAPPIPVETSSPLNLFALMSAIRDIFTQLQDPALLHMPPSTRKLVLRELA